jgi:hypothetical protein
MTDLNSSEWLFDLVAVKAFGPFSFVERMRIAVRSARIALTIEQGMVFGIKGYRTARGSASRPVLTWGGAKTTSRKPTDELL